MAGITTVVGAEIDKTLAAASAQHAKPRRPEPPGGGWLWLTIAAVMAVGMIAWTMASTADGVSPWAWLTIDPEAKRLRWLLALLPGSILVNHMVYLLSSRRRQFSEALAPGQHSKDLADLYFARGPLLIRYLLPAALATILCSTAIAALTAPRDYAIWLWAPGGTPVVSAPAPATGTEQQVGAAGGQQAAGAQAGTAAGAQAQAGQTGGGEKPAVNGAKPAPADGAKPAPAEGGTPAADGEKPAPPNTAAQALNAAAAPSVNTGTAGAEMWPEANGWGREVLRGAALGFVGAYVYILLLLTERARQHDITSGLAVWTAAMPVLGPLMGGVAALLLASGAGLTQESSFTRDAVFFVAGMLPQQFAAFVQSGVRRLFQGSSPTTATRTLPLTLLRGVGPQVEARLEEESIHDVSALAYASPYALIRSTTYAPKQIADWIDEALLVTTVPMHWDALEKVGVTGAMDLAWYRGKDDSIKVLAEEVKMPQKLLENVIERLDIDAQVGDLRKLYWDDETSKSPGGATQSASSQSTAPASDDIEFKYRFLDGFTQEARDRLTADLRRFDGVKTITLSASLLTVSAAAARRDAVAELLRSSRQIAPDDGTPQATAPIPGPPPVRPAPPATGTGTALEAELKYRFAAAVAADVRLQLVDAIAAIAGVNNVSVAEDGLTITIVADQRDAIVGELARQTDITPDDGN